MLFITISVFTLFLQSKVYLPLGDNTLLVKNDSDLAEKKDADSIDPFISETAENDKSKVNLSEEGNNQSLAISLTPEASEDKKTITDSSLTSSTNELENILRSNIDAGEMLDNNVQLIQPNDTVSELAGEMRLASNSTNNSESASTKDSKKQSQPFWTEVYLNDKKQKILVTVRTVTIIEETPENKGNKTSTSTQKSTSASKPTSSISQSVKTTSASSKSEPFIRIRMPSSSSPATSKSNSSSTAKTSSASANSSKKATTSVQSSNTTSSSKSKSATSISSSGSKSKAQTSSNSKSASSVKSANTQDSKNQSSSTTSKSSASTAKKSESSTTSSVNGILNIFKNMPPSGGSRNSEVYVEGTFIMPKEKNLDKKPFSFKGYIS